MKLKRFVLGAIAAGLVTMGTPELRAVAVQKPSMPGYPAPGAPPAVTVLATGSAPRTALRYRPRPGLDETMDMTMVMGMTMEIGEMSVPADLPAITLSARLQVTDVAQNGDISMALAFTKLAVAEGGNPQMADVIRQGAGSITSVKGVGVISSLGVNKSVTLDTSAITDPAMKQTMTQMTNSLQNMSSPLPEEPMGVGGRWEVRSAMESGGMTMFQKAEYEIVSIDGLALSMKVKADQTAPVQAVSNPDLPPGVAATLTKMMGSGAGTMALRLDNLVPTSSMDSNSSMTMTLDMGGQTQKVSTALKLSMKIGKGK